MNKQKEKVWQEKNVCPISPPHSLSLTISTPLHHLPVTLGNEKALQSSSQCVPHQMLSVSSVHLSLIVSGKLILHSAAVVHSATHCNNLTVQLCTVQQPSRRDQPEDAAISVKWRTSKCASNILHTWPRRTSVESDVWEDAHSWCQRGRLGWHGTQQLTSGWRARATLAKAGEQFNGHLIHKCPSFKLFPSTALRRWVKALHGYLLSISWKWHTCWVKI